MSKSKQPYHKKTNINRISGKLKKWKCYDDQETDRLLDGLEVLYTAWRSGRGTFQYLDEETSKTILDCLEQIKQRTIHYTEEPAPLVPPIVADAEPTDHFASDEPIDAELQEIIDDNSPDDLEKLQLMFLKWANDVKRVRLAASSQEPPSPSNFWKGFQRN